MRTVAHWKGSEDPSGREKMVVDLYIPAKSCTHTYYAAEIYYHGRPREGLM